MVAINVVKSSSYLLLEEKRKKYQGCYILLTCIAKKTAFKLLTRPNKGKIFKSGLSQNYMVNMNYFPLEINHNFTRINLAIIQACFFIYLLNENQLTKEFLSFSEELEKCPF